MPKTMTTRSPIKSDPLHKRLETWRAKAALDVHREATAIDRAIRLLGFSLSLYMHNDPAAPDVARRTLDALQKHSRMALPFGSIVDYLEPTKDGRSLPGVVGYHDEQLKCLAADAERNSRERERDLTDWTWALHNLIESASAATAYASRLAAYPDDCGSEVCVAAWVALDDAVANAVEAMGQMRPDIRDAHDRAADGREKRQQKRAGAKS